MSNASSNSSEYLYVVYAPGIHTGGGLSLLKNLISSATKTLFYVDHRALNQLPSAKNILLCPRGCLGRIYFEFSVLRRLPFNQVLFCFSNLPPIFRPTSKVITFCQNRLIFDLGNVRWPLRRLLKFKLQWTLFSLLKKNSDSFWVQTTSMKILLEKKTSSPIFVQPFVGTLSDIKAPTTAKRDIQFLWVGSREPHKKLEMLFETWPLIQKQGQNPSLHLVVLASESEQNALKSRSNGFNWTWSFNLRPEDLASIYSRAQTLLFTSTVESLGLPLLEARQFGLLVVAPELDYVRDTIDPDQCFEPSSPLSLARAIMRVLNSSWKRPTLQATPSLELIADNCLH